MTMLEPRTISTPLGRRIKAARALAGLEQVELAERLNVARGSIGNWEAGRSEPSATLFVRLAQACGVALEWLAEGVNDETAPAVAGAVQSVRPEGLEPPTFCSVAALTVALYAILIGQLTRS